MCVGALPMHSPTEVPRLQPLVLKLLARQHQQRCFPRCSHTRARPTTLAWQQVPASIWLTPGATPLLMHISRLLLSILLPMHGPMFILPRSRPWVLRLSSKTTAAQNRMLLHLLASGITMAQRYGLTARRLLLPHGAIPV